MVSYKVFTNKGPKNIEDVTIFDSIYDYSTGKELPIIDLFKLSNEQYYHITLSDDRFGMYRESDYIEYGNRKRIMIADLYEKVSKYGNEILDQFIIKPNKSIDITKWDNYPHYTAGAIIPGMNLNSQRLTMETYS